MTPQQREDLINDISQKSKDLVNVLLQLTAEGGELEGSKDIEQSIRLIRSGSLSSVGFIIETSESI